MRRPGASSLFATTYNAAFLIRRRSESPLANSPSNLAMTDQLALREQLRADGGQCGVVRDLRAVDRESPAGQRLKRSTQRRIADKVVRPGDAAVEHQRPAIGKRRRVEARAQLGAHVGRSSAPQSSPPKPATGRVDLAKGRRVEVLELHRAIRRHAQRRQHGNAIAAFGAGAVALSDKVRGSADRPAPSGWW